LPHELELDGRRGDVDAEFLEQRRPREYREPDAERQLAGVRLRVGEPAVVSLQGRLDPRVVRRGLDLHAPDVGMLDLLEQDDVGLCFLISAMVASMSIGASSGEAASQPMPNCMLNWRTRNMLG
jgi:hypothetical protein